MFILETIPIKRGVHKDSLSYFHSKDVLPGSIVSVPIRGKSNDALVISSVPAKDSKMDIKSKSFSLKKISKVKSKPLFLTTFIEAVKDTANFHAGSFGSTLNLLTPKEIIENASKAEKSDNKVNLNNSGMVSEHLLVQDEDPDRISAYKSLIREEFAKNKSVFFCLPTGSEVRKVYSALEKGIGDYAYAFYSGMRKKEVLEKWNEVVENDHPVLIVATGSFLSIPRKDIGLVIIDRESSRHYKLQSRPYVDIRRFAETLGDKMGARVVFGDIALRVETIWRYRSGELAGILPPKFKYLSESRKNLVDMKKEVSGDDGAKEFKILSDDLKKLVDKNREDSSSMVIFAARRGLSPTTVCNDCGAIVKCSNCKTPTVLHKSGRGNVYLCHRCNNLESPEKRCDHCGSWKLQALGIGIQKVEEELLDTFPNLKIYRVDSDTTKTEKQVLIAIEKWQNNPGSVLLCTEMAIPFIDKAENVAISSIDALFSVPDFRINEKVLGLLLTLRSISSQNFILQTRNLDQIAITAGMSGNLSEFYRHEIKEREEFGYPPFYQFIKITLTGDKTRISKEMTEIASLFEDYEFDIFPALSGSKKGKAVLNALIRLKRRGWPEEELLEKFNSLPPKFSIKVDPESLL